jgi:hypothetical protein
LRACSSRVGSSKAEAETIYVTASPIKALLQSQRRSGFTIKHRRTALTEGEEYEALMAERSIDRRERYVGYANHCLELAKATTDPGSRAMLREMAAEWLKLAEAPID